MEVKIFMETGGAGASVPIMPREEPTPVYDTVERLMAAKAVVEALEGGNE